MNKNDWFNKNKEYFNEYKRKWREQNKEDQNKKKVERYQNDLNIRLKDTLRSRLRAALKKNLKTSSAVEDLGCSMDEFRTHLESQFEPWMNWDNYGRVSKTKETWQIDHIIPLSSFNLTNPDELKKASHYTNLRPLRAKDNLEKGNKIDVV